MLEGRRPDRLCNSLFSLLDPHTFLPPPFFTTPIKYHQNPMSLTTFVVTLHKPEDITWEEFTAMMGEEGYPVCGKVGLIECLMRALSDEQTPV
jgi:hypothetical protein